VSARASSYNGLLTTNVSVSVPAFTNLCAGCVYQEQSFTAPTGVQFGGFAYTSGSFWVQNFDTTGGISAGFEGTGGSAPTDLNFPWTTDCSVSEDASPRTWINNGAAVSSSTRGPYASTNGYCGPTGGNTSGWNYDNAEVESTNPAVYPYSDYQTLSLLVWCARNAACNYSDSGSAQATNLSGHFDDSWNTPAGSITWTGVTGNWVQTDNGGVKLDGSAWDPAGVCDLYMSVGGPENISSGLLGNQNPAVTNVGGAIGTEFTFGTHPCWLGVTDTGEWTLPGGLPSGTYGASLEAANPGNYQSQGFNAGGSPDVANTGSINVDDTTPNLWWGNPPSGWTAGTSELLDVSVGPSGLASLTCTDNGANIAPALASGSTSGAGTTIWSVPTAITGANNISCTANNGDANGALVGSGGGTFDVDSTVPNVTFADGGYTEGQWASRAQTIQVAVTGGPSGIRGVGCLVDGARVSLTAQNQLVVSADGQHTVTCTGTSNTGISGSATFHANIDTRQPTVTFLVNSKAPTNAYQSGTPVVTAIGGESGGILSGLKDISCSVNGGAATSLSGIDATSHYTGSFELQQNGADHIRCVATTAAGTVQSTPSELTVNVDNPNYAPNASSLIDNGADPYSNGPSQSHWYVTPQPVTITADNTGGTAPIASITCKGALSGTWPSSTLNADSHGGEQITVTVPAPGGDLSCVAQDSAGNVYALGSYLFQIDSTAPRGSFLARSDWPAPDEIAIHASDNGGSGVATLKVYGESPDVEQGAPQLVGDARYDSGSNSYIVTIPDGVSPWVAGSWKFYANIVDVAGNQGQITAGQDGSTEELTLPLREDTAVSAISHRVAATPDVAIPDGLATAALPSGSRLRRARPASRGTIASTARGHRRRRHHHHRHALTVRFGSAVSIRGTLKDVTHHGVPISGARILVYERLIGAHRYVKLGSTRTNAAGTYRYKVRPGASRTLYVVYPGNTLLRPAASHLLQRSRGSLTLAASSIRAGGDLVMSGRVRGGHVPHDGLEVTIDYRQLGAPGSGTLGTVRTDRSGRYRFMQHFSRSTTGLAYEVWAVVPGRQSGWPYLRAATPHLIRRVS
jgi:hypothetical protein